MTDSQLKIFRQYLGSNLTSAKLLRLYRETLAQQHAEHARLAHECATKLAYVNEEIKRRDHV